MSVATLGLAFGAGVLSILAPCVLPLLPIVFASAASRHAAGPVALAGGVVVSFVAVGLAGVSLGASVGLDPERLRMIGAALFVVIGLILLVPAAQMRIATAAGPLIDRGSAFIESRSWSGWPGQFGLGVVLGLIWSPCIGPTLASAMVLAARGDDLWSSGLTMMAFGVGALLPLVGLAFGWRVISSRWRARMAASGKGGKIVLGTLLLLMGAATLSGIDRKIEAFLLDLSPPWLTDLTTRL